jgi:isoleucyl-tRNA synthetase
MIPFLSEAIYGRLRSKDMPISVHLTEFPVVNIEVIDDRLESRMELAQSIVSLARFLREKSKIRIRQPLNRILLPVDSIDQRRDIQQVSDIIKEELNIKEIEFITDNSSNIITKRAKANYKTIGKKFGKDTKLVADLILKLSNDEIKLLEKEKELVITSDGASFHLIFEDIEVTNDDIEG